MINKETALKSSVAETIVRRDYDFIPPEARDNLGSLSVPILRISVIQLEVVLMAMQLELVGKVH